MTSVGGCLRVCSRRGARLTGALHRTTVPLNPVSSLSCYHPRSPWSSTIQSQHELLSCRVFSRPLGYSAPLFTAHHDSVASSGAHQKPKAVIFDLGGVVVPSPQPIFDRFEEQHNLKIGSLIQTIKAAGDDGAFARMERGELTVEGVTEPFTADYKRVTGVEISTELVKKFMGQLSDFTKLTPNPGVVEVFEKLRSKGIKVAILTNNFCFDSGRRVFPQKQLNNVDVVSSMIAVSYTHLTLPTIYSV